MNLMRTTQMDNLRAVNRIDSIKRRQASKPAQQTVIHKELAPKPTRVEVHTIEPTTTTNNSLTKSEQLLKNAEPNFFSGTLERIQHVKATAVTIGESVRQTVTKTADILSETVVSVRDVARNTVEHIQQQKVETKNNIANSRTTIQGDRAELRTLSRARVDSARAIGQTLKETAVSVGQDVLQVASTIRATVANLGDVRADPTSGPLKKGWNMIGALSTGVEAAKVPIANIGHTVKNSSGSIQAEVRQIRSNFEESKATIGRIKETTVSIGQEVTDFVSQSAQELKAAGAQVGTLGGDAAKDVQTTTNAGYDEVVAIYRAAYQPNERIERTPVFA